MDGRQTAFHWAYGELFSRYYPMVRMRKESILCLTEKADRIVTAGGVTAWQDLALYLITRFCEPVRAHETARVHLLDRHVHGQLPYAAMNLRIDTSDAVISASQRWIARHYARPQPVETMAERSGPNARTFARRFKAVTGRSPIDYVQALRVEEAKNLLENGALPPDEIAARVGYEDGASFRRTFRSRVGLSPAAFRRTFA